MRNSAPAEENMPLKRAIPPKIHRVMPSISIPSRRACRACPSSWSRIEAKNASEATTAIRK